jgi:hypothetical protein
MTPLMRSGVEALKNNLLGQIPGYGQINTARSVVADFQRIRQAGDRGQQALFAGALLIGTSLLAYSKFKESYRSRFPDSGNMARNRGIGMQGGLPDIGGKRQITFAVDSSVPRGAKAGAAGEGLRTELMSDADFDRDHHVVSIKQSAHRDPVDIDSLSPRDRKIAEAMSPVKQALQNARNGQNDAAVELAAQAFAYSRRYPDRSLNIIGHGDGGMVAHEAAEILKNIDTSVANRLKVATLNTPDFGLTDPVGQTASLASRNSPISFLPMKKKVTIDAPDSEGGRGMLRNSKTKEYLKGFFSQGGSQPTVQQQARPTTWATTATQPMRQQVPPPATQPEVRTVQWRNPPSIRDRPPVAPASESGVVKTTTLGSGQQELPLNRPAATTIKSSVARDILKNAGPDELVDHQQVMRFNPTLSSAEAYQVSSLGGLPTRLRNEYIEGKVGLPTALEIAREIAYDDRQKRAYMKELTRLRAAKPNAGIDTRDYLTALSKLRGDSSSWQMDSLKKRIDALKLRVG